MKKLKLFLPALFISLLVYSQPGQISQINITNFTVKNTLPATIDNWLSTPGALMMVAQKLPNSRMMEPRLSLQIRSGGAIICGTTVATAKPVDPFDVRTFNAADLTGFLGNCHELKEGTYTICAQFFNIEKIAISKEVCKDFRVEATNTEYSPPTLIIPDNGKKFTPQELQGPVLFRWTPLVPKPQEPVTYRLKVWQLMQGQNATTAMRTNQPIVSKDVDNLTQASVSGIYTGPCKPPYLCDYTWQVQALNRSGKPMGNNNGNSEPYSFGITEVKGRGPDNLYPQDKKEFTPDEAKKPITFRWTPVDPKPAETVTYRLRVWQLMQGQNGGQAMKSNQPIITKEVDNMTEATVTGIYTGPCRPPYLCDFIWNVEAITRQAGTVPKIIGTSSPTTFVVAPQYIIQLDSIKVFCTAKPGVYSFKYCITNPNPGTARLILFTVTSSVPAGATMGTFSPPLNTLIPSNGQLCITGTINGPVNLSNICIGAGIQDVANNFWQAQRDTCVKVEPCTCNTCDSVKIDVVQKDLKFDTDGNIILNTTVSVSPKPVKSIKAELVYFEYKPESDDCMLCNKDSKTFGNFNNGTHSQEWNFSPPKNLGNGFPASMVITVPPTVKCCNATIKWCIRYVVTFDDCTVCNKLLCYELNKEGCANENHNPKNGQK